MSGSRRKPGAVGPHVEGFRGYLVERHYTPGTVRGKLKVLGHLGRWMETRGLIPGGLSVAAIEEFLIEERDGGSSHRADRRTLLQLLDYLMSLGAVEIPVPEPKTEVEQLLDEFRDWSVAIGDWPRRPTRV